MTKLLSKNKCLQIKIVIDRENIKKKLIHCIKPERKKIDTKLRSKNEKFELKKNDKTANHRPMKRLDLI